MEKKEWIAKISCGALVLSLLACSPGNENEEANQQSLYQEVAYEQAEAEPEPFTQEGVASYYARSLAGSKMANGEPYQPERMTAAHKRLPLGTKVEVVNQNNGNAVVVEITDRGPYVGKRIIDLSRAAARKLDFMEEGKTQVALEVVEPADGHTVADVLPRKGTTGNN